MAAKSTSWLKNRSKISHMTDIPATNGAAPPSSAVEAYAPKTIANSDISSLDGSTLILYGEKVAKHVEDVGNEFLKMAEKMKQDCDLLASDVRTMCELQAKRSQQIAERSKTAALDIKRVREDFRRPLEETT